jgi:hypothetical protein
VALTCALASGVAFPASGAEFRFERLNRSYSQFVDQLTPVVLGPVEVLLHSPVHQLELVEHRAVLDAADDGTHRIRVEIDISGHGTIDAVLRAAGVEGKLSDQLKLPLQTLAMDGRIRLARGVEGYTVTLVEAPQQVEVEIESQLAGRLVPLCRNMALVLVRFDCAALQESLSKVNVPIPDPGAEFLLPIDEMSEADRRRLDGYLEHSRRTCCRHARGPHAPSSAP